MAKEIKLEQWQIAFLRLTYVDFGPKVLAEYLGFARTTFAKKVRKLDLICGQREKIVVGQRFDKLVVMNLKGQDKDKRRVYRCICDCGKEHLVTSTCLLKRLVKSCGCLLTEKGTKVGNITHNYLTKYRFYAERADREFTITLEYIWDLFVKQDGKCALTGLELTFNKRCRDSDGTASIDRIDSKKGYIPGNIQWVHKDINFMKQEYDQQYFIEMCKLVVDQHCKESD